MPTLSHVGLPVLAEDHPVVVKGLELLVGAVNLGGGQSPSRETTWLQIDSVEVHIISTDDARRVTQGATFSPHLAFAVESVAAVEKTARAAGLENWRAGTLPQTHQVWVQLGESCVLEFQEVV